MRQNIIRSPFARIIIGLVVCVSAGVIGQSGSSLVLNTTSWNEEIKSAIAEFIMALFILAAYKILYKFYERRSISELSSSRLGLILVSGILLGAILQSLTIYVLYLKNGFLVSSVNSFTGVLPYMLKVFADSITVGILLIGIFFRITEEKLGSYITLVILALIFVGIHLASPNGTVLAAISISIHAALLLGAAYIYSRNLWLPIAIHFSWDFMQAGIFGAKLSGNIFSKSLLTTKIEGPSSITGGYFGPQGSIQAGLFCLTASIIFLLVCQRQNKIMKPSWKKAGKF